MAAMIEYILESRITTNCHSNTAFSVASRGINRYQMTYHCILQRNTFSFVYRPYVRRESLLCEFVVNIAILP